MTYKLINMPKITVTPKQTSTDYHIHVDFDVFTKLPAFLKKNETWANKWVIITDTNVKKAYGDKLLKVLQKTGIQVDLVSISAGEKSKNLELVGKISSKLLKKGYDRKSGVIALGGGVVGDFAGFVASIYLRGVSYIHIPTSLLAMVDSAIGGKVGIDTPEGKNLLGDFYQPKAVLIDLNFLEKLPQKQLQIGLAEIVKYGVIYDVAFFEYLSQNVQKILQKQRSVIKKIVTRSAEIKAEVVSKDEKESNLRQILNYGHTYGHAIELLSQFALSHGEAIAIGMHFANILAEKLCNFQGTTTVNSLLEQFQLPTHNSQQKFTAKQILDVMLRDKKVKDGDVYFVLPEKIGKVVVKKVSKKDLSDVLKKF